MSYTFPAGMQIADARIAAGEPITQDLMHDFRDRDQDAADLALNGRMLLNIHGDYYNETAGAMEQVLKGYRDINSANPENTEDLMDKVSIYIPDAGIDRVAARFLGGGEVSNANLCVRITIDGDAEEWCSLNLAGTYTDASWHNWKYFTISSGAGAYSVTIEGVNKNIGAARWIYFTGIQIVTALT